MVFVLSNIEKRILKNMKALSIFVLRHQINLTPVDPALRQAFVQQFSQIESEIESFLKTELIMDSFLWPFILLHHVRVMTDYYRARVQDKDVKQRIKRQFKLLQSWFKEALVWSVRTRQLLESEETGLEQGTPDMVRQSSPRTRVSE